MLMLATAGVKPCEMSGEPNIKEYGFHVCEIATKGYDAAIDDLLSHTYVTDFSDFYRNIEEGYDD